jgi:hypothetical protein
MGRNDIDNDAPASDAVLALDAPERATRAGEPPPVGDAVGLRPSSGHRSLPHPGQRRIGRPTRLTPRLAKALVKVIAQTGRIEPAARRCGVSKQTVCEWLARGHGRHPTRGPGREYAKFADAVEKAFGQYECDQLAGIQAAAAAKPENWTARAWQLERWDPQRYGRRTAVDHTGTITVTEVRGLLLAVIGVLERYVPVERRETELANLLAEARELGGGSVVGLPAPRQS